jgi:hypothetical protein
MGWERGRYYTRSRKVNGRVVREYVGSGKVARLAAELDSLDRSEREARKQAWQETKSELAHLDEPLDRLNELADLLARAALVAAGYRQHKRGEWRKQRARGNEVR